MKAHRKKNWREAFGALAVLALAMLWTSPAKAQYVDPDTVRWTCGGTTTCNTFNSGGVATIITTDKSPTLAFTEEGTTTYTGEAFMVVLVPDAESSGLNFTVSEGATSLVVNNLGDWTGGGNGKLLTTSSGTGFLGIQQGGAGTAGSFNSFTGISDNFTSAGVTGYTVYVVDLGAYTGSPISFSFGGDGLPPGTVLWGLVANSGCTVSTFSSCTGVDSMPYSETVTVVPEPGTLALLGSGLLLLGGKIRRRLHSQAGAQQVD